MKMLDHQIGHEFLGLCYQVIANFNGHRYVPEEMVAVCTFLAATASDSAVFKVAGVGVVKAVH